MRSLLTLLSLTLLVAAAYATDHQVHAIRLAPDGTETSIDVAFPLTAKQEVGRHITESRPLPGVEGAPAQTMEAGWHWVTSPDQNGGWSIFLSYTWITADKDGKPFLLTDQYLGSWHPDTGFAPSPPARVKITVTPATP
ncbi:MAG: hypothetical protein PHE83_16575 [Opitutaceae bacterium]|nr:hypothetical protein [Opitutaceae bacterium]